MSHRAEHSKEPRPPRKPIDPHQIQALVKILRDAVFAVVGLIAFIHEFTRQGSERVEILIISAAMMGLPVILRGDEKRQEVKERDDKSSTT